MNRSARPPFRRLLSLPQCTNQGARHASVTFRHNHPVFLHKHSFLWHRREVSCDARSPIRSRSERFRCRSERLRRLYVGSSRGVRLRCHTRSANRLAARGEALEGRRECSNDSLPRARRGRTGARECGFIADSSSSATSCRVRTGPGSQFVARTRHSATRRKDREPRESDFVIPIEVISCSRR
jgi:hypothetical protein